jgi:hypothetical protein
MHFPTSAAAAILLLTPLLPANGALAAPQLASELPVCENTQPESKTRNALYYHHTVVYKLPRG